MISDLRQETKSWALKKRSYYLHKQVMSNQYSTAASRFA